jgi:hypothetical protein
MRAPLRLIAALSLIGSDAAMASDHLDTPTVIADPRADIGDIYGWIDPDGRRLDLAMTIVGHSFSDKLAYVFHIDSGARFGATVKTVDIVCRFKSAADCRVGHADRAVGDASGTGGLWGRHRRLRVFAGLRDDPFFNNVRGTRQAYDVARQAIAEGARRDATGCPGFGAATSAAILDRWRHIDSGPATNFLAGWTPDSIIVSVDLAVVNKGGPMLALWGATVGPQGQIDRAGRPLTGNALLATLGSNADSDALKEAYNRATPATGGAFVAAIAQGVADYDGFDGQCGNGFLTDRDAPPARRYWPLASLLADDRLWLNSASAVCTNLFAVGRAALGGETGLAGDCGGRAPDYDAVNVYRSLLATGRPTGIDDSVHRDERETSRGTFPFLAAPEPAR